MDESLNFEAEIQSFEDFPGMHYLPVSKDDIQKLGGKFNRRYICTVNGLSYHCAIQSLGDGTGWIGLSKARMKELDLSLGSTVNVTLVPDKSKYGLPMPKELSKVLKEDKEAKRRFAKLTPGRQRNILHHVGNAKVGELRLKRALTVIKNLKRLTEGRETASGIFGAKSKFNRQS